MGSCGLGGQGKWMVRTLLFAPAKASQYLVG